MTDQERSDRTTAWTVRQACLTHAMAAVGQGSAPDADAVVAFATKLEAYVLRDVTLNKVAEAQD